MSGNKSGGLKTAQTIKDRYGQDYYHKIGSIGGRVATGHAFAYGKVSPSEAGKLGGNRGPRSAEWKARQSQVMKDYWAERKLKERVFVPDSTDFGAGFFAPTWKQRLIRRFK